MHTLTRRPANKTVLRQGGRTRGAYMGGVQNVRPPGEWGSYYDSILYKYIYFLVRAVQVTDRRASTLTQTGGAYTFRCTPCTPPLVSQGRWLTANWSVLNGGQVACR